MMKTRTDRDYLVSNGQSLRDQVRVLIADDHNLISEAVSRVLSTDYGLLTKTCSSVKELVDKAKSEGPFHVILLDIAMDGMRGLRTIKDLCKNLSPSKIILFSGSTDVFFFKQAIDLGVMGFIPKDMHFDAMDSAIRLVYHGEIFIPSSLNAHILSDDINQSKKSNLRTHEIRILDLTANGYTNKEIATMTGMSETQIKMLMRSICKKLDAKNRTHAVVKAREMMII